MMLSHTERRRAFRAALILAEYDSVEAWATERGYNRNHVHCVLRGERLSARLQVQLDAFAIDTILRVADTLRQAIEHDIGDAEHAALAELASELPEAA